MLVESGLAVEGTPQTVSCDFRIQLGLKGADTEWPATEKCCNRKNPATYLITVNC